MKRRNFIAALLAIPFSGKELRALEHRTEWMGAWWLDVTDFGATGDGETDDTQAIQKAVDASGAMGGGIVFLPPYQYVLSESIRIGQHTKIRAGRPPEYK